MTSSFRSVASISPRASLERGSTPSSASFFKNWFHGEFRIPEVLAPAYPNKGPSQPLKDLLAAYVGIKLLGLVVSITIAFDR